MKHIKIVKEDVDLANEMSVSMGTLNNSITKGRGNVIGFLGEIIVAKELGSMKFTIGGKEISF